MLGTLEARLQLKVSQYEYVPLTRGFAPFLFAVGASPCLERICIGAPNHLYLLTIRGYVQFR